MVLALDVGNTQIFGGVINNDEIILRFRRTSKDGSSSDELGVFLRSVLRENSIDHTKITKVAICTVVPQVIYSLTACCKKYFNVSPFILQAGVKTGLKVKYRNPLEVGSDRIADAIGASKRFPDQNLIIVDLGTATTISAITKDKEFLGGAISPGVKLSMEALEARTSKLLSVEIVQPKEALGRSTMESIQSGLYFSQVGLIKEITSRMEKECFKGEKPKVVGTGGFAYLFEKEELFDAIVPDLVLEGLYSALKANA